jgi:hypothetical protein
MKIIKALKSIIFLGIIITMSFSFCNTNSNESKEKKPLFISKNLNCPDTIFKKVLNSWLTVYFNKRDYSYKIESVSNDTFYIKCNTVMHYESSLGQLSANYPVTFKLKINYSNSQIKAEFLNYKVFNNDKSQEMSEQYSEEKMKSYFGDLMEDMNKYTKTYLEEHK